MADRFFLSDDDPEGLTTVFRLVNPGKRPRAISNRTKEWRRADSMFADDPPLLTAITEDEARQIAEENGFLTEFEADPRDV